VAVGGLGGQAGGLGAQDGGIGRQEGGMKMGLVAVLVVAPLVVLGLGVGVICEYGAGFFYLSKPLWLWGMGVLMREIGWRMKKPVGAKEEMRMLGE